jgi:hypothetical protein
MKQSEKNYQLAQVKKLVIDEEDNYLGIFSKLEVGVLKWDYIKNICFVNDFLIKTFNINVDCDKTIHTYLKVLLDDNTRNQLSTLLSEIREKLLSIFL